MKYIISTILILFINEKNTFFCAVFFLAVLLPRLEVSPWGTWMTLVGSGLSGCCLGFYGLAVSRLITAASVLMLQNMSKAGGWWMVFLCIFYAEFWRKRNVR